MCPIPKSLRLTLQKEALMHFPVTPTSPSSNYPWHLRRSVMTVRCMPNGFSLPSLITNYRSNLSKTLTLPTRMETCSADWLAEPKFEGPMFTKRSRSWMLLYFAISLLLQEVYYLLRHMCWYITPDKSVTFPHSPGSRAS